MLLAYELHHLDPNLRIVAACCFDCWDHVAVTNGTHMLDVHGWSTFDTWAERWGDHEVYEGTVNNATEYRRVLRYPPTWTLESTMFQTGAARRKAAAILISLPRPVT